MFAKLLFSLSMAGVPTSFLYQPLLRAKGNLSIPLLRQKSASLQKSVLYGKCLESQYFPLGIPGTKEYFPGGKT